MKKEIIIKLFYLLLPSLLLVLFFKNIYYSEKYNMDIWLGGGMRMFSSIDHSDIRMVGFYTTVEDSTYFINLNKYPNLYKQSLQARILPSPDRLEDFTQVLEKQKWCLDENKEIYQCSVNENNKILSLKVDTLVIYRVNYTIDDHKVKLSKLTEYTP